MPPHNQQRHAAKDQSKEHLQADAEGSVQIRRDAQHFKSLAYASWIDRSQDFGVRVSGKAKCDELKIANRQAYGEERKVCHDQG